jgi:hypothetical protein
MIMLGVGCASSLRETSLSRGNVGTKYARQTGYFAACGTMCSEEETRGGIRHDVILDEIMLAQISNSETCFDVMLRTEEGRDEPFTELSASCVIDGKTHRPAVESELVSVYDYAYVGMSQVAVLEGIAAQTYVGMALSQPTDKVFRVIARQGRMCCPQPAAGSALIALGNRQFDFGASKGKLEMRWSLSN